MVDLDAPRICLSLMLFWPVVLFALKKCTVKFLETNIWPFSFENVPKCIFLKESLHKTKIQVSNFNSYFLSCFWLGCGMCRFQTAAFAGCMLSWTSWRGSAQWTKTVHMRHLCLQPHRTQDFPWALNCLHMKLLCGNSRRGRKLMVPGLFY